MMQNTHQEESVGQFYENYQETQKDIYAFETRKTRNKLFLLAIIFLGMDLIAISIQNQLQMEAILLAFAFPLAFAGLALLAKKEPLTAVIICAILIALVWGYSIYITGGRWLISGLLIKIIIVYLVISASQHAITANKIKKELKL